MDNMLISCVPVLHPRTRSKPVVCLQTTAHLGIEGFDDKIFSVAFRELLIEASQNFKTRGVPKCAPT